MGVYFFDTSALVNYYHLETGRSKVVALLENPTHSNFISRLTLVELHSVLARKVRTNELTEEGFHTVRRLFYADLRARKVRITPLEQGHHLQAILLMMKHGLSHNLRTLDALQLATTLEFHQKTPLDHFVCADAALCQIAHRERLAVLNPED
ncbi:MAG: PIN domain-containing protein [Candidatus Latescibacteria bacterium]|nr:PIN domain-containing protein [Candidatus Latescibacterota bacterium]